VYRVQFEVAETTEQVFVGPDSIFFIITSDSVRFSTSGKILFENEIHGTVRMDCPYLNGTPSGSLLGGALRIPRATPPNMILYRRFLSMNSLKKNIKLAAC